MSAVLPEISSNPTGIPKINDRASRLASGHLPVTLNLPAPVVILYAVKFSTESYIPGCSHDSEIKL